MQNLPLHRIVPDPDQPRQTFDAAALADLQDSLWPHGLVEPIVVTEPADPEGLFKILVGERRYQAFLKNQERAAALFAAAAPPPEGHCAHRYNRWTEIPAVFASEPSASDRILLQLVENKDRLALTLLETARGYARAFEFSGLDRQGFCAKANLTKDVLSRYLSCAQASNLLLYALEQNLVRDLRAVGPFRQLPRDLQESFIRLAQQEDLPITRAAVEGELIKLKAGRATAAAAAKAPPPAPSEGESNDASPTSQSASQLAQPRLGLTAVAWLAAYLPQLALDQGEAFFRDEVVDVMSRVLNEGCPLILLQEDAGLQDERRSPISSSHTASETN